MSFIKKGFSKIKEKVKREDKSSATKGQPKVGSLGAAQSSSFP